MTEHLPGDIRLMSISGDVGKAIRLGQWLIGDGYSPFEHAQVYLGNNLFIDAEPGGAKVQRYTQLDAPNTYWSTGLLTPTDEQRGIIVRQGYKYQDTPYSFYDYGAIALHALHLPIPGIHSYINSVHHMICSQLCVQCYLDADYRIFSDNQWDGFVTPGDLFKQFNELQTTASTT